MRGRYDQSRDTAVEDLCVPGPLQTATERLPSICALGAGDPCGEPAKHRKPPKAAIMAIITTASMSAPSYGNDGIALRRYYLGLTK